ncbi:MAG: 3-dehydroquinate synthase family protein [Armatimonadota bacterium]
MTPLYTVRNEQDCHTLVERGAFLRLPALLQAVAPSSRVFVLTDTRVADLHLDALRARFAEAGLPVLGAVAFTAGDQSKSATSATAAWDALLQCGFARRDVIVALGGGMVMDLAGFVAASFMRGVPYVNVPTTLLAQVDAGFGGKVAVNHGHAKNLIGAFHHPLSVIADPDLLDTLPARHFCAGMAEIIKVAVIGSPVLFARVAGSDCAALRNDSEGLLQIIAQAVDLKLALVLADPFEQDLDRALNFGHTVGHALEAALGPDELLHGEGVAWGIAAACGLARQRQLCSLQCSEAILSCLERYQLLAKLPRVAPDDLWVRLAQINLIRGRRTRWVLPVDLGEVTIVSDVTPEEFTQAWTALQAGRVGARCPDRP